MTEFFFNQTEHGFAETRQSALKFREKVLQKCDTRIRNLWKSPKIEKLKKQNSCDITQNGKQIKLVYLFINIRLTNIFYFVWFHDFFYYLFLISKKHSYYCTIFTNFRAHCSRIVSKKLTLSFLGGQPMTFKPGMPLEGQVSVLFNNYISLKKEEIEKSKLTLTFKENRSGNVIKQLVFRGSSERVFNRWVSILPIIAYM